MVTEGEGGLSGPSRALASHSEMGRQTSQQLPHRDTVWLLLVLPEPSRPSQGSGLFLQLRRETQRSGMTGPGSCGEGHISESQN
jgi:hypothetical protein